MSNYPKEWQDTCYVCPVCKQSLIPSTNGLCCPRDGIEYPVKNGIVNFVTEDLMESTSPFLRSVGKFDDLAKIYEGPSWYGILDQMNAELDFPSIEEMATMMTEMVDAKDGLGLDVACGTGFIARHLARKMRLVYGIDISMGMLGKATEYTREKGIKNVHFSRANVERLPFPDGAFDGVTCSGALHLFPDTVEALREIARAMKSGARLAVLTMVKSEIYSIEDYLEANPSLVERFKAGSSFSEEESEALHLFDVEELERYFSQTGFKGFEYNIYGPYLLFHAEKG